jgi:hypothetical protein
MWGVFFFLPNSQGLIELGGIFAAGLVSIRSTSFFQGDIRYITGPYIN